MSWITASIIFLMGASVSLAQLPTATILGAVKDSSGAVVPGVSLAARNTETGQTRTAVSGGDGSYRFSALPVGNYEVRAEHAGFRAGVRSGLTLTVSQEAVINFTLEVGAIEQTVAVTAEAPLVNTTSGSLGGLVSADRIADLPLNGRNYIDLTLLQTGVVQSPVANVSNGAANIGAQISSNGANAFSNNYMLDGASMVNFFGATSSSVGGTTLGVEGIREYRVVTNSFSAEYGMTMGSQMTIVSKGGTNAFHGSAFEYLRNNVLDARNFFDYTTRTTPGRLPAFKRNNFGASFGGPIKKDKTFFFGVYEGLRERKGLSSVLNVIPAAAKVDGGLVPQIAPVIKPWLPYFPDPNLPNNQYALSFSQPSTDDYGQMRVDQTISASDTAFARYTIDNTQVMQQNNWPGFTKVRPSRNQYLTFSENHVFSPTLLNTFRASLSRTNIAQSQLGLNLVGPQFSFVPGLAVGVVNIGGLSGSWGTQAVTPQHQKQNIWTYSDDMFDTRGRHALKFGVLLNHYQWYTLSTQNYRGSMSFSNVTSFLLGQPNSIAAATPGSILDRAFHFNTLGFYAQDDLRVSSKLTLNLGLRYEFNTTFNETKNQNSSLRDVRNDATTTIGPPFINPSLRNFSPRFGFAWDVMGDGKTAIRGGFGLLYNIVSNIGTNLNQGTCDPPFCNQSTVAFSAANPVTLTLPLSFPASAAGKTVKQIDYHLQQPHMLQYNLTVERQLPGAMALTLAYAGSRGLNLMQWNEGNPTVPQLLSDGRKFWTGTDPRINPNWGTTEFHTAAGDSWYNSLQFGLIKRLSKGLQFQSSYTWSRLIDTNQGINPGDSETSHQMPQDPACESCERGVASYDITHNWRFNAIYRLPDVTSSGGVVGALLNGWRASGILSLQSAFPFTVGVQANRSRSGVNGGAPPGAQTTSTDRPNLVAGRTNSNITSGTSTCLPPDPRAGQKLGTQQLWYDPCAFTLQPAGFIGNAGRNILRGPGVANFDFSLSKDTPLGFLGEGGKLEFRADFFNILNHANFATPALGGSGSNPAGVLFAGRADGEAPLATAGRISLTSTASRQLQLSLRIVF